MIQLSAAPSNGQLTAKGGPNLAIAAADYDPSMEWHDYSTAQDWMGRNPVHVGNLVDMYLYGKVTALISQACPAGGTGGNLVCNGTPLEFETLCLHNYPEAVVRCKLLWNYLLHLLINDIKAECIWSREENGIVRRPEIFSSSQQLARFKRGQAWKQARTLTVDPLDMSARCMLLETYCRYVTSLPTPELPHNQFTS